jgi:hypothetical protein
MDWYESTPLCNNGLPSSEEAAFAVSVGFFGFQGLKTLREQDHKLAVSKS